MGDPSDAGARHPRSLCAVSRYGRLGHARAGRTYNENVVVNKAGLTLQGSGPGVIIEGTFRQDNGFAEALLDHTCTVLRQP